VGLQTGTSTAVAGPGTANSIILPSQSKIIGVYGGIQVTRRLSRYMLAYGSYTAQHQSLSYPGQPTTNGAPVNVLNGLSNIIGFGFGFSPVDKRLRRE
jgi:hypothetical protein